MGYYHDSSGPPPEDKPPGCLETLVIMRAVFAVIVPVLIAMIVLVVDIAVIFVLFTRHPALALIPVAFTVIGIWLFARWDQQRFRPPGV
ncbi:MAG: hypothetical protein WEB52_04410 [Dehalococcoidia bacterium]